MKAILQKLYEETARMDRCILLAGAMAGGDAFPDDLNDFFNDENRESIEMCFGKIPDYVDIDARRYERSEAVYEWLLNAGKLGYLIQFATPVMTQIDGNLSSFSWGYYNTTWIYSDTLDEAIEKGLKWVESRRAAEKKKAKKKGGAA